MTTLTFEPVIEGMMDRRREPERDADMEEHTDKRGEEEQAQRMKELMDCDFRTRDAVSYYSEVSGSSVCGVSICLADRGQILVFDQQHEKLYKVARERVTRLSLSEFPRQLNKHSSRQSLICNMKSVRLAIAAPPTVKLNAMKSSQ
jgi:hypothetical protein